MKKNVIALLLSIVLAAGNIGAAPVFAAETTAEGAVAVDGEETESDGEETASAESEEADLTAEDSPEEETVQEETVQESDDESVSDEPGETVELPIIEEEAETAEENEAVSAGDIVDSGSCGDNLTWVLDEEGVLTISGTGEMYDYQDDDYNFFRTVPWEAYYDVIREIIIEEGVTSIGTAAFNPDRNGYYEDKTTVLEKVEIADSVTEIGHSAFAWCQMLTEIELPEHITSINRNTFFNCYSLTSITIPKSVTSIPDGTFYACYSLEKAVIPNGNTQIETNGYFGSAFEGTPDFTIYSIPGSLVEQYANEQGFNFEPIEDNPDICIKHIWSDEYIIDKEPTMTEAGSESIHCTVCGAIDESSIRVIPKLGFSVDAEFVLEKPAFNYTGKPIEPGVTVTYNGKQLVRDKDYKVTYGNNIDLGQADVDVTGIGNYTGTEHLHFTIRIGAPKKVTCTNVASGMKVSWTKVNGATRYKVYRDGKYIFTTSALEVTDKEVKYKGGTKYVYKVVATEKRFGDSELFKTSTCYRLMPVGIKSLTNPSAGKMTVTYDKSAGCYGYVVRYGLKADMSDAHVVTVQGQNMTSRTFGGMKKGKTYFVQVRTYKLDNGVRYYSGYCTTKKIVISR